MVIFVVVVTVMVILSGGRILTSFHSLFVLKLFDRISFSVDLWICSIGHYCLDIVLYLRTLIQDSVDETCVGLQENSIECL
jgi:hypothetical protein